MSESDRVPESGPPARIPPRNAVDRGAWRHAALSGLGALLGILIAFGVDAWWERRSDLIKEAGYLDALHAELLETRSELEQHMKSRADAIATMRHQIETVGVTNPRAASPDSVAALLVPIAPYYDFAPKRAALDEMIASGGLRLLRSPALRRALATYEQALVLDRSTQDDLIAFWRTQMSPYLMEHANWPITVRQIDRVEDDIKPRASRFPFQADPDAFYGNRTYANLLMSRMLTEGRVRQRQREVLRRLDEVLALIGDRPSPSTR